VSRASGSRGHAYREPASDRQAAAMREGAHGAARAHLAHSILLQINCIHVTLQSLNGTDLIIFFLVNCIVLCFVTIMQSFSMISLVL
jgi:hypothetical protein